MGAVLKALTWSSLERRAASDRLRIVRQRDAVTIYSTAIIEQPMVSFQVHDLADDERVLMGLVDRALTILRKLE